MHNHSPMLYPYQRTGIEFLLAHDVATLGDDPGLGKTRQAAEAGQEAPGLDTRLVLCPAAVARQWQYELIRWVGVNAPIVPDWNWTLGIPAWAICPYSRLHMLPWRNRPRWDLVIADEAHFLKTSDSKRTKYVSRILHNKCRFFWMLTGTPIPNRPAEVAHIWTAFWPDIFGTRKAFLERYCGPHEMWIGHGRKIKTYNGSSNLDELRKKILQAGFLLRRTRSVVGEQMPAKQRHHIFLEFDKEDIEKALAGHELQLAAVSEALAGREAVSLNVAEFAKAREALGMAKAVASIDWLEELCRVAAPEGVVVFCYHRHVAMFMELALRSRCISAEAVTGDVVPAERAEAVRDFQEKKYQVFIATIGSCGVGLDGLQCTPHVVILEPSWVPGENDQAEGRVARIGGCPGVNCYWLSTTHYLDCRITRALMEKRQAIDYLLS